MSRTLLEIPQGSLYPALHRLEGRGWLDAEWTDSDSGRRTKVYRLTRKGRAELEREIADWRRLSQAIDWILQT
jgi:DNA-binding PadR family transcriptional regulator